MLTGINHDTHSDCVYVDSRGHVCRSIIAFLAFLLFVSIAVSLSGCGASAKSAIGSSASSSAQKPITIEAKTSVLEYSNKTVDPVSLITGSDKNAKVTAKSQIDLATVGTQSVVFEITSGGQTSEQTLDFTVRDTKAPKIALASSTPSIEQGAEYDPRDAISSVADEVDGSLPFVESAPEARGGKAGAEVFYDQGWYTLEGSVNSSNPGTYLIKVLASDKHGNTTSKELKVSVTAPVQEEPATAAQPAAAEQTYVANKNTKKFHHPECPSAKQIKQSNRLEFTTTRSEMIDMGYDPCKRCNP